MSRQQGKPVTIAFAREHCVGIEVHCPHGHMAVIGFERFEDAEVVPDLVKTHVFVCSKCGSKAIATRPHYPGASGIMNRDGSSKG